MKMNFKLTFIALLVSTCLSAHADDAAIIGKDCANSHECVTSALQDFYVKILPMKLTPKLTLTDFTVRQDISVASVLINQSREELISQPSDATDLSNTIDQYARQMTCGVSQSMEQIYMKTGGQIIWKYYFSDGEYLDSRAFGTCN
jgi:hypothetical protein